MRLATTKASDHAARDAREQTRQQHALEEGLGERLAHRSPSPCVAEHAVRVAVGDQVDRAAVGRLQDLRRELARRVRVEPPVEARHGAHVARDGPDVVGDHDDGHRLRELLRAAPRRRCRCARRGWRSARRAAAAPAPARGRGRSARAGAGRRRARRSAARRGRRSRPSRGRARRPRDRRRPGGAACGRGAAVPCAPRRPRGSGSPGRTARAGARSRPSRARSSGSPPSTRTLPRAGCSSPSSSFTRVVLPLPFGPSTAR